MNNVTEINHNNDVASIANQQGIGLVNSSALSLTNALTVALVDGFENWTKRLQDFADFAVLVENNDGSSQINRRLEFPINQKCQQAHIALFGNRSAEEIEKGEGTERRSARFCASLNLAYWERRWFGDNTLADTGGHMQVAEYVDPSSGEIIRNTATGGNATYAPGFVNEPDGQWGASPEKQSCMIRFTCAKKNYAMVRAEYDLWTSVYTVLTDKAFEYVPYQEKTTVAPKNQSQFASAAAAAAAAMKADMESNASKGSTLIKRSA